MHQATKEACRLSQDSIFGSPSSLKVEKKKGQCRYLSPEDEETPRVVISALLHEAKVPFVVASRSKDESSAYQQAQIRLVGREYVQAVAAVDTIQGCLPNTATHERYGGTDQSIHRCRL